MGAVAGFGFAGLLIGWISSRAGSGRAGGCTTAVDATRDLTVLRGVFKGIHSQDVLYPTHGRWPPVAWQASVAGSANAAGAGRLWGFARVAEIGLPKSGCRNKARKNN